MNVYSVNILHNFAILKLSIERRLQCVENANVLGPPSDPSRVRLTTQYLLSVMNNFFFKCNSTKKGSILCNFFVWTSTFCICVRARPFTFDPILTLIFHISYRLCFLTAICIWAYFIRLIIKNILKYKIFKHEISQQHSVLYLSNRVVPLDNYKQDKPTNCPLNAILSGCRIFYINHDLIFDVPQFRGARIRRFKNSSDLIQKKNVSLYADNNLFM